MSFILGSIGYERVLTMQPQKRGRPRKVVPTEEVGSLCRSRSVVTEVYR